MPCKHPWITLWGLVLFLSSVSAAAAPPLTADRIAAANIRATLGDLRPDKLGGVELELQSPPPQAQTLTYCVLGPDRLRVGAGVGAMVENVFGYDGKAFVAKGFAKDPTVQEADRVDMRATALLSAGAFSLAYFRKGLVLHGTKKMGPEEYHVLSCVLEGSRLEFFVDTGSKLLRRLVIHSDPKDRYSVNQIIYEFQPPREGKGPKVPGGIFKSDLGARTTWEYGGEYEVRRFETGKKWPLDFFRNLKTNFGKNELVERHLAGNTTNAMFVDAQQRAVIYTNLTHDIMKKAGYAAGSRMRLTLAGKQYDIFYGDSQETMTPAMTAAGGGVLTPSRRLPYGVLLLYGAVFKEVVGQLTVLSPIELTLQ